MNNINNIEKMILINKLENSDLFKRLYQDRLKYDIRLYLNDMDDYSDDNILIIKDVLLDFVKYIKNI